VMDEYGQLLGINEVRQRITDGRPLMLNREANWNRRHYQTKENYLYNYMAKNLYRLQCAVSSEYDAETAVPGKVITYVQLLPLDYFDQEPDRYESVSPDKVTYVSYNTNNQAFFWAEPGK
ncbi:MAG: transglutaminase domain-containing protein, partial [Mucilaginibacter sp.]